jgi:cysteinyl-tRNA synthetase
MHVRFLTFNNQKMSKSKGTSFTSRELSQQYSYDVLRFLIVSANYGSPINFSEDLLIAANNGLERIKTAVSSLNFIIQNAGTVELSPDEGQLCIQADSFKADFEKAMDDDFNSADAVTAIFELVKFTNINVSDKSSKNFAESMLFKINELCGILGIETSRSESGGLSNEEIEGLIEKRNLARKNKDYKAADEIRNMLAEKGITLEDTPSGVRWR